MKEEAGTEQDLTYVFLRLLKFLFENQVTPSRIPR